MPAQPYVSWRAQPAPFTRDIGTIEVRSNRESPPQRRPGILFITGVTSTKRGDTYEHANASRNGVGDIGLGCRDHRLDVGKRTSLCANMHAIRIGAGVSAR